MANSKQSPVWVSGLGIVSAIGQGREAYFHALLEGRHNFHYMQREGRNFSTTLSTKESFIGAEISAFEQSMDVDCRNMSLSAQPPYMPSKRHGPTPISTIVTLIGLA